MNARLATYNVRWPYCPGSLTLDTETGDRLSNAEIEDLKTHHLLTVCIRDKVSPYGLIDTRLHISHGVDFIVNESRAERVQVALDYIRERTSELTRTIPDCECYVEAGTESVPGKGMMPPRNDWQGVCDVLITVFSHSCNKPLFIEAIDFDDRRRYRNVNNCPVMIGVLRGVSMGLKDLTSLRATIIQPKADKKIQSQSFTTRSIKPAVEKLELAVLATDDVNSPLIPGKHCMYCEHKPSCTGIKDKNIKVINAMDKSKQGSDSELSIIRLVHTELESMSEEQLENILDAEKVFIDAFARAKVEAVSRLNAGNVINGYFMGSGKAKKVWNEDAEIIGKKLRGMHIIKDEIYPFKLVTPAQALKFELSPIRRKNLEKLINVEEGAKTLKQCDKYTADEMFGVSPEGQTTQPVENMEESFLPVNPDVDNKTPDEMFKVDDVPDFLPEDEQDIVTKTADDMFDKTVEDDLEFNFL